ncbi:DUF2934 domain-containing protein [Bradyrhizobium erythrophlei]
MSRFPRRRGGLKRPEGRLRRRAYALWERSGQTDGSKIDF